jgi:hypothetical protein
VENDVREIIGTIRVMAIWQGWIEQRIVQDGLESAGCKTEFTEEGFKLIFKLQAAMQATSRDSGYKPQFRLLAAI